MLLPVLLQTVSEFRHRRARRREQHLARLAFSDLRRLDAHMLADIGMTWHDLDWGMTLPIEVDAARAVRVAIWERRVRRR